MRVEPGAARLALAPRRRLTVGPEAPDPDDRRRHADTEARRRLPRRQAVRRRLDHATAKVAAVGLHHRSLPTHRDDGIREGASKEIPNESAFRESALATSSAKACSSAGLLFPANLSSQSKKLARSCRGSSCLVSSKAVRMAARA